MQELYLGWEKVSFLERRPQFRSVLIERELGSTVVIIPVCVRESVYLSLSVLQTGEAGVRSPIQSYSVQTSWFSVCISHHLPSCPPTGDTTSSRRSQRQYNNIIWLSQLAGFFPYV